MRDEKGRIPIDSIDRVIETKKYITNYNLISNNKRSPNQLKLKQIYKNITTHITDMLENSELSLDEANVDFYDDDDDDDGHKSKILTEF